MIEHDFDIDELGQSALGVDGEQRALDGLAPRSVPPAALTEHDVDRAFARIVPTWMLERLDTRLGTVGCVAVVKTSGVWMWGTSTDDGPFPDYAFHGSRTSKGFDVEVTHGDVVLRAGRLPWNRLANMATIRACEVQRRDREPLVGEQLALGVAP
jgi:hypothetical protein